MKGRKLSEEHREKLSESHKGKKLSEEHREKLSESHKNPSKETRKKMSEAVKKRPKISEATRKKMSVAMTGKKMPKKSEATLKRMSEALSSIQELSASFGSMAPGPNCLWFCLSLSRPASSMN